MVFVVGNNKYEFNENDYIFIQFELKPTTRARSWQSVKHNYLGYLIQRHKPYSNTLTTFGESGYMANNSCYPFAV